MAIYNCGENEECICTDINGVEIEESMILIPTMGSKDEHLYCVMKGESGKYYLVSIGCLPQDIIVKPIRESENYEVCYDRGRGGFYPNYKVSNDYSLLLKGL